MTDTSNPVDFDHMIHVGFDPVTGEFTVRNLWNTDSTIMWDGGFLYSGITCDPA